MKKIIIIVFGLIALNLNSQQQIKDIRPGNYGSNPAYLNAFNGMVYFRADTSATGNNKKMWRSDGTSAGTILLSSNDVWPSSGGYEEMASLNGFVFFGAIDPVYGLELFKTDGSVAGTNMVKDIFIGPNGSSIENLIEFNGNVYFWASNGFDNCELWKSDGTESGTVMVMDIRPGQYGSICYSGISSSKSKYAILNNELYFAAWDGGVGQPELWKTDGTNTSKVKPSGNGLFATYPENLFTYDGKIYFSAKTQNGSNNTDDRELYVTDGTDLGTVLFKEINTHLDQVDQGSFPYNFTIVNNVLYFAANDGNIGTELWRTDGTPVGTVLVKDINVGGALDDGIVSNFENSEEMISYNNTLYFAANNLSNGVELWKSDGTAAGTVMVKDIYTGNNSYPGYFCEVGGILYFAASDAIGNCLWKTDGTLSGTNKISSSISNTYWLTNLNDELVFSASQFDGQELWKYSQTPAYIDAISEGNFEIFPNPTSGKFKIMIDLPNSELKIKVYNTLNQIVYESDHFIQEIDLSNQPNGIYYLQLNDSKNQVTQKIVINH